MDRHKGNLQELLLWYHSLSPIRVDIVGDFAGKELFAIHGDSLLLYCTGRGRVDMENGFQLLHAVYAVEAFLEALQQRGCSFNIVWFHEHEQLCMPKNLSPAAEWNYRLTRAIVIKHLERRDRVETVSPGHSFSVYLQSDSFQKYLDENAIYFFLSLDGQDDEQTSHNSAHYLQLFQYLSSKGYSTAALNTLEVSSSKVYASVQSPVMSQTTSEMPELQRMPRSPFTSFSDMVLSSNTSSMHSSPWDDGQPCSDRDHVSLNGLANTLLLDHEQHMRDCVVAFVIHLSVLRHLDLSQRACREVSLTISQQKSIDKFLSCFSNICTAFVEAMSPTESWDVFDLIDGRILRQIYANLPNLSLPGFVIDEVRQYVRLLDQSTKVDLSASIPDGNKDRIPSPAAILAQSSPSFSVLAFKQPILEGFLSDINLSTTQSVGFQPTTKVFQELSHFHNARRPIDIKAKPQRPDARFSKRHQRLMASTIAYAASLTNTAGKSINPETIVSDTRLNPPSNKSNRSKQKIDDGASKQASREPKSKSSADVGGRQAALKEASLIQARKSSETFKIALSYWDQLCRQFENDRDLDSRYRKVVKYLANLGGRDVGALKAEASLYLCNCLALTIYDARKKGKKNDEMGLLAIIWSKLLEISSLPLSREGADLFNLFAKAVKFPVAVAPDASLKVRKLPFRHVMAIFGHELTIPVGSLEFQLLHCGPYLERGFDSAPDTRVPFNPDAWQRKVLDAIDANQSLFVVAPTSSGKTFISFYAMKKVLQSNDDDVLVYVAPTKALVNQIAAEIQARFSKSYTHAGKSVWAIHTRDYRINNSKGCQILITVPHILQIMLLHPFDSKDSNAWALRIKRIVFDEVHCIGQTDEGIVWEQLLLMAPCPIIALSATVGNPAEFKSWLEASERAKGHDLTMIGHSSRYSDLRKFIYFPPQEMKFEGLSSAEGVPIPGLDEGLDEGQHTASRFSHIHPIATLVNRNRGKLDDISLEPRDCFVLWQYMSKHQTKCFQVGDHLNPEKFLPAIVKKSNVTEWEASLKRVLERWIPDANSPFLSLRNDFQSSILQKHSSLSSNSASRGSKIPEKSMHPDVVSPQSCPSELRNAALPLLADLHRRESLPAILFNYDRNCCEDIVFSVSNQLKRAEDEWKSRPAWEKKIADFDNWKKSGLRGKRKEVRTRANPHSQNEEDSSKMDAMQEEADKDISKWQSFDPEAPLDMFSFADRTKLLDSDLEDSITRLAYVNMKPEIVEALRRGVGVHHAGMNREYRQIVEMLFRKGYIRVVVATGTLAMGINMPCKSIVFFGDSVFLTALNYNQGAGRAGRRGFDVLGNVVFVGMPPQRTFEIMSSRLPDLRGQFPLSTSLVLRLMGLLHHTNNSAYAVRIMRSIQSQSRLFLGGPSDQMTIKHHLRFSIEYLRRQDLLSEHGAPLNFAGLVGHLYFTENAVFAFHSLLRGGYFHGVCRNVHQQPLEVALHLVLILSHLFCRIPLRKADYESRRDQGPQSPSIVRLPALPRAAEEILVKHNKETLDVFRNYVGSFIEQHLSEEPDNQLPFTKCTVQRDNRIAALDSSSFLDVLPPTKLRSAFAALSGFTDEFQSIHDLCTTVRAGVFLEESAVPYIPIYPNNDASMHWNAYIYDFYKHGDMKALVKENGIKAGDVWFHLKDFSLILAAIVTTLENYFKLDGARDEDALVFEEDSEEDPEEAAGQRRKEKPKATLCGNAAQRQSVVSSKPKAVMESWDDDSSQDDDASSMQENGSENAEESVDVGVEAEGEQVAGDTEESLPNVLKGFKMMQSRFDEAFKKVWA
ncbi:hypothetical protein E4U41_006540 [Claviceps citrina]|nr:hypothetical protein E4U41_006540 [Claviceps citrina]